MSVKEQSGRERATSLVELHKRWTPTMEVQVWGAGKATRADKRECRDTDLEGGAKYAGDCDNCDFFMGCRFVEGKEYFWGDHAKGCCALDLEAASEGCPEPLPKT